jgi:parallel beta-helix repeat protein
MRRGPTGRSGWAAAFLQAFLLLVLCGPVPTADATHIACGARIEADATLDSDLLDCPGNGVVIGASGMTLDLAGHTITGGAVGIGIANGSGASGLTVRNGTVIGFRTGVAIGSGSGHLVRNMSLFGSHDGLLLNGVMGALVERIDAAGNDGSGIHTPVSRNVVIRRSHVHDNAAGIGGVGLQSSKIARNVIERNTFYGIRYGAASGNIFLRNAITGNGEFGIALEAGSAGNRVVRNRVAKTSGHGIFLADDSGANHLSRNRSDRNTGDGIAVMGSGATLIRNSAARNGALGIDAPSGVALARRNVARHNGDPRQCVGVPCAQHGW